jgi:subtilisin family serine protease
VPGTAAATAVAVPACSPAAVSVGAVYSADSFYTYTWGGGACTDRGTAKGAVTCFSNSTSFLSLLAPGAFITGGGITMGGTSQASPHVAGALAILRGAFPSESLDATVTRLKATGKTTLDRRNGLSFPLMDIGAAASGCYFRLTPTQSSINGDARELSFTLTTGEDCEWSVASSASWLTINGNSSGTGPTVLRASVAANTGALRNATLTVSGDAATETASIAQGVDVSPPTGTVVINNGATSTNAKTVALTLTATDPSGVAGMCVTNAATCTVFEPFASAKVWSLAGTLGTARVSVFLKDSREIGRAHV